MKIGYKNEIKQLNGLNFIENAYNFFDVGSRAEWGRVGGIHMFLLLLWVWVCQWMGYYNNKRTIKIGYDDDAVLFE